MFLQHSLKIGLSYTNMKLKSRIQKLKSLLRIKAFSKPKRMYILCANDRFNYGDLLFPFILKEYFKSTVDDFVVCSTTSSNMSDKGALPTEDFSCLTKFSRKYTNILIIGGGECIFCNWQDILGYVSTENTTEKAFPTQYPFTISKDELRNLDLVMYNSVGCHQLNEREDLYSDIQNKNILKTSDYIAVRDSPSSLGISRMNLVHYRCADSAILMSKVFCRTYLENAISAKAKAVQSGRYIFFQMGLVHLKGRAKTYAEILNNITRETGLNICLCPIGTAIGHDDPQALDEISDFLHPNTFVIVEEPTIWDIMSLICNSEIYVGTSLHGAITAMSYKVPLIAHGPKKLQVYIETWYDTIGSEYSFVSIDNLENAILRRLKTRFIISPDEQIQSVENSFERMRKIINNAC